MRMVPTLLFRRREVEKMKAMKRAWVTGVFLLIPLQGPFAGPADRGGQIDGSVGETALVAADAPSAVRSPIARRAAVLSNEGFVWSVSPTHSTAHLSSIADHRETDGYSWSVPTVVARQVADPIK